MTRTLIPLLALSTGCVVYTDSGAPPGGGTGPVNYAPHINWADGGCYYDGYYGDDIWYFEADVNDPDGALDVTAVYADVYDSYTGEWVDSFELYPTAKATDWYSDWLGHTTYLDCYYGGYIVDITAYDSFDATDHISFVPVTYAGY